MAPLLIERQNNNGNHYTSEFYTNQHNTTENFVIGAWLSSLLPTYNLLITLTLCTFSVGSHDKSFPPLTNASFGHQYYRPVTFLKQKLCLCAPPVCGSPALHLLWIYKKRQWWSPQRTDRAADVYPTTNH